MEWAPMRPGYPYDDAATARAVIDGTGTLAEWNKAAAKLLGHTAAEVVGRPAAELLADGSAPRMPEGPRQDGTLTLRHRDGSTVTVWLLPPHRAAEGPAPGQWLVVTPLDGDGPLPPEEDPLERAQL